MATVPSKNYADYYDDGFVSDYDRLVGWDARRRTEGRFFIDLLLRFHAHTVLDAACGTGYHALELASAGFDVHAADGSASMLAKADEHFQASGLQIPLRQADWRSLADEFNRRFDAVLCVGDSFSHLFEDADRQASLRQFWRVMVPGGILIIDHRNYEPVIKRGRVDPAKQNYCCCGDDVEIQLDLVGDSVVHNRYRIGGTTHELHTYPMQSAKMRGLLTEAGFAEPLVFGDYQRAFDPDDVEFLVYAARKL